MIKFIFIVTALLLPCRLAEAKDIADQYFNALEQTPSVSMDLKNTALVDVLRVFSKQSGMNFVAADDIADKRVTLFLDNVPIKEALNRILQAHRLTYETLPNSNIFVVKAKGDDMVTRVYNLKYATVSSSKLNTASANNTGDGLTSGSSSLSTGASGASARGSLVTVLRSVISKEGSITEDARTNSLVITDTANRFPAIEATIAKLDVPIVQVMIEVEMLDISKTTSDLMGAKFGNEPFKITGGVRDVIYPWNQNRLERKGDYAPTEQYTAGKIDASGMQLTLNFLKTQTDTRSLAKPRLMTLDNETAQIRISTNEAIGETSVEGGQSGNISTQAERVQTGVFLTVTPQVNLETQEILMSVSPKVIEARRGATFSKEYRDPEERGSQSMLMVKDGETIVLGGLLRENNANTITKVPFFGDLPLIGAAFRHKNKSGDQRELIIFITPHIIGSKERYQRPVQYQDPAQMQRSFEMDALLDKIENTR